MLPCAGRLPLPSVCISGSHLSLRSFFTIIQFQGFVFVAAFAWIFHICGTASFSAPGVLNCTRNFQVHITFVNVHLWAWRMRMELRMHINECSLVLWKSSDNLALMKSLFTDIVIPLCACVYVCYPLRIWSAGYLALDVYRVSVSCVGSCFDGWLLGRAVCGNCVVPFVSAGQW